MLVQKRFMMPKGHDEGLSIVHSTKCSLFFGHKIDGRNHEIDKMNSYRIFLSSVLKCTLKKTSIKSKTTYFI